MTRPILFWDSETFLIQPGLQAPPVVCFSYCLDGDAPRLIHARSPGTQEWLAEALRTCTHVLHNAAFDLAVICANWPSLTPLVFRAYDEDRVTCTETRQKLIDIARGRGKGDAKLLYDLGSCSERAGGPALDKSDPWRTRYGTLASVPVAQWPEEARRYSLLDAEATRAVYLAQEKDAKYLEDQYRQARASFWIALMTAWGFATDKAAAERYIVQVRETLDADRRLCEEHGLVRPDGTKNTAEAGALMERLCEAAGVECPRTPGGAPSLSEESVDEYGDHVLEAYQRYANANTRSKRAQRLLDAATAGVPIQARFNVLVNTGRTSCSQGDRKVKKNAPLEAPTALGAQIQNPSKEPGYRECFRARHGFALVSIDYDALELHTWSQVCLWLFGYSRMAESINRGGDQHTELAAQLLGITEAEAYARKNSDATFSSGPRFFSKMGNFGFLADMSPATFCVNLTKQAVHSGEQAVIDLARSYTVDQATQLKNAFTGKWTESQEYFEYFKKLLNRGEVLEGVLNKHGKPVKATSFTHFKSKRVRGRCTYTQILNSPFQGLASDIKKDAFWRIARECYVDRKSPLFGSRTVNDVHDEWLGEVPLDRLHEAAYRARDIMVQTAEEWCEGLKFTAEPAAMAHWSKGAKTVFDSNGRLVPWKP